MDISPRLNNSRILQQQVQLNDLKDVKLPTPEGETDIEPTVVNKNLADNITANANELLASQNMAMISIAKTSTQNTESKTSESVPAETEKEEENLKTSQENVEETEPDEQQPPMARSKSSGYNPGNKKPGSISQGTSAYDQSLKILGTMWDIGSQFLPKLLGAFTLWLTPTECGRGSSLTERHKIEEHINDSFDQKRRTLEENRRDTFQKRF